MTKKVTTLLATLTAVLLALSGCTFGGSGEPAYQRVVSAGYETVIDPEAVEALDENLDRVGADTVAISAGRADWATFRWEGHEERWAAPVRNGSTDPFADAVDVLGQGRDVVAVVDVFAADYLKDRPDLAARTVDREAVDFQVSISELTTGTHGDLLVEMVGDLAAQRDVDAVNITELHYDVGGFGPADEALFVKDTRLPGWPRDSDGDIRVDDPRIGEWRSKRLAGFVQRLADAVHEHRVELLVDVRSPRDGDLDSTIPYAQDYEALLQAADRLVVWHYVALHGPDSSEGDPDEVLATLVEHDPARFIVSVGVWGEDDDAMPASQLDAELARVERTPLPSVWVTPASLLSDSHWAVLGKHWPR